jgi:hypothetical protein
MYPVEIAFFGFLRRCVALNVETIRRRIYEWFERG